MGRLRTYDRIKIANDLLAWSKLPTSLNVCGFCGEYEIDPELIYVWSKEDKEFAHTYRIVKSTLGQRRELALTNQQLHVKAYDLNAATYDHFLKEERRSEKEFEASLAKQSDEHVEKVLVDQIEALNKQLVSLQALRIADKSKIKD